VRLTIPRRVTSATLVIGIVLAAAGAGLEGQDLLSAARDLYASAAYEDALSTLSGIDSGATASEMRQADEYRAFCLYALGRTREAELIAESMVRKEPLARLGGDASPRLETMFADVRRRLLPSLIRDRFRIARSAIDQKSFGAAEAPLTEARLMIVEAEKLGVTDGGLMDLSVLVDGFLQLIHAAPAAPSRAVSTPAQSDSGPISAVRPPQTGSGPRIYSVADADVSPPIALEQRIPAMTTEMQLITKVLRTSGLLDIVIDETGRVVNATIRQSLNTSFDALIVQSARRWKYRPAMKDGRPVRYVKALVLVP
jgi:hypothetical protein